MSGKGQRKDGRKSQKEASLQNRESYGTKEVPEQAPQDEDPWEETRRLPGTEESPGEPFGFRGFQDGDYLLSHLRSTIGVAKLNFSVRNGKRWNLRAIVT